MNQAYQATAQNYNVLYYEYQNVQQDLSATKEIVRRQTTVIDLQSALIEQYKREAGYVTETELEDVLEATPHEEEVPEFGEEATNGLEEEDFISLDQMDSAFTSELESDPELPSVTPIGDARQEDSI
jgi:hypothetical protein